MSRESYLLHNCYFEIPELPIMEYNNNSSDIIYLPNYLTENELYPIEQTIYDIRQNIKFNETDNIGEFIINSNKYKYIAHQKGRYDIWNIANSIKKPTILSNFTQKSIGCLFLDHTTDTDGKWHKDTVNLFDSISNINLPPFYYNMLIATDEINKYNGPTQFLINDIIYWVPMKRGDALIFNGEIIHRGTKNISIKNRDLIYAIYTTSWYDEEIL